MDPRGCERRELKESLSKRIEEHIDRLLERLYEGLGEEGDESYSVYTGIGGIAHLHLHMYSKLKKDRGQLECALDCLRQPLRHLKGQRISFLCGDAGPLALGAVIYDKLGSKPASKDCVTRLVGLQKDVCRDPSLPDELLYGRAGYLYALLFVRAHLGDDSISTEVIHKVYKCITDSGIHMSQQQGWRHPLMYAWHEKHYLGAAHGLVGIFYILMHVKDESLKKHLEELIRPSLEYMLTLRFPSGNCPSSVGSSTGDKLVHWCHGAPGWIHMFIMAYKEFGEDRYLQAAKACADVIWSRGLLKKGFGLCHGISGNAYAFLAMYKLTDDQAYLYKAYKFATMTMERNVRVRIPDHPYSLFEGLAGTIYFLIDLLDPKSAKFPAFDLP
ncbi:lanC-like protein 2 isoform X2 [Mercenaria mercenaria]|uniref:lanC-like protein 2 isoform X2 n=1 Tax=Mercenaria mercenaria TaxID=6596 RepID=UPI00234EE45A|nr:lanC-like protein 2 isoform X2 [Mercenaria mercenaria]